MFWNRGHVLSINLLLPCSYLESFTGRDRRPCNEDTDTSKIVTSILSAACKHLFCLIYISPEA